MSPLPAPLSLANSFAIAHLLQQPHTLLVTCFCAAWCDTCRDYMKQFKVLSDKKAKQHVFLWIDIEDYPELCGDEDIENFPTISISDVGGLLFYGTLLPHISHLERLIDALSVQKTTFFSKKNNAEVNPHSSLPNLRARLLQQLENLAHT